MSEFDSPWKEALERFFRDFMQFFFPVAYGDIDWERGHESLDKELEKITREGEIGKRVVDKLFKVWLKDGREVVILIHIEIQAQRDPDFPKRIRIYNFRIFDRFGHEVVSLAILADESPNWRPQHFEYNRWGFRVRVDFPIVKLLDYANDKDALEADPNPVGLLVLAHLQSQATRNDPTNRCAWKVRLLRGLLERGYEPAQIRQLFRLIDWFLDLPPELEAQCDHEIEEFQKEKKMPHITGLERVWMQKGERKLLQRLSSEKIQEKFAAESEELLSAIAGIDNLDQLHDIYRALETAKSADEIRSLIPTQQQSQ